MGFKMTMVHNTVGSRFQSHSLNRYHKDWNCLSIYKNAGVPTKSRQHFSTSSRTIIDMRSTAFRQSTAFHTPKVADCLIWCTKIQKWKCCDTLWYDMVCSSTRWACRFKNWAAMLQGIQGGPPSSLSKAWASFWKGCLYMILNLTRLRPMKMVTFLRRFEVYATHHPWYHPSALGSSGSFHRVDHSLTLWIPCAICGSVMKQLLILRHVIHTLHHQVVEVPVNLCHSLAVLGQGCHHICWALQPFDWHTHSACFLGLFEPQWEDWENLLKLYHISRIKLLVGALKVDMGIYVVSGYTWGVYNEDWSFFERWLQFSVVKSFVYGKNGPNWI